MAFGLIRKKAREEACAHEYILIDYDRYVDWALVEVEQVTLSCRKCGKERKVDPYNYGRMKGYGLIYDKEGD